jgi:hypothetical protein
MFNEIQGEISSGLCSVISIARLDLQQFVSPFNGNEDNRV